MKGDDSVTDDELIRELRESANVLEYPETCRIMRAAADRIEELSERVAIMAADMDKTWGESYCTASKLFLDFQKD